MSCDVNENVTERQVKENMVVQNDDSNTTTSSKCNQDQDHDIMEKNNDAASVSDPQSLKDDEASLDELEEGEVVSSDESDGETMEQRNVKESNTIGRSSGPTNNDYDLYYSRSAPVKPDSDHDNNHNIDDHYHNVNRTQRFCAFPTLNEEKMNRIQDQKTPSQPPPPKKKRDGRFKKKSSTKNTRKNKSARQRARAVGRNNFHGKGKNKKLIESNAFPSGPDMAHSNKGKRNKLPPPLPPPPPHPSMIARTGGHPIRDSVGPPLESKNMYRGGPLDNMENNPINDYAYRSAGYVEEMNPLDKVK